MAAYADVILALHHMKRDIDLSLEAEKRGDNEETDLQKAWGEKHRAAWDKVREQIDVGEFLYSPDSVRALETLNRTVTEAPDEGYLERLFMMQNAVDACLPAIKAAARADLRLPPVRGWRAN